MAAITRRHFALAAFAPGSLLAATLPSPVSLQTELAAALQDGNPLVVMASLDGCPFCKLVRDSHLAPMHSETGQPIVQIDTKSKRGVLDFNGNPATHDGLLQAWRVKVLPTVLFFGKGGVEVAPRLVGASIPDFYGAYLGERLRVARAAVR